MKFEVFTVAEIHILTHPEDGGSVWYPLTRIHGAITQKTTSSAYGCNIFLHYAGKLL
jgi:hypothetical protein